MAGQGFGGQLGKFIKDIREKAGETVARQEAAFVRGKIAGTMVQDDEGAIIVDAGHFIDEAAIARAERAGKLGALVMSAGTAQVQDLREKASDTLGNTQDGREARNLDSVDENREAMTYVGRYTGVDVTDIRGNVVVPAGKKIGAEDVHKAREAGLLSALIYSGKQGRATAPGETSSTDTTSAAGGAEYAAQQPTTRPKRASLPLVGPDKKPDKR